MHQHYKTIEVIFMRLRKSNLQIQPDKCEFLLKEVAFLGHIVTKDGVKPNPDKITAIKNYLQPKMLSPE